MLASRSQPLSRLSVLAALWLVSAVATAQQGIAPAQLKCTGNEPFWSVDVGPGNALLDRLADHAQKSPEDWSRLRPGLAPGIGACINDGGVPVASVAHAAPLQDGRASALLRSTDGPLQTCTVDPATRRIESIEPLAGTAPAGA